MYKNIDNKNWFMWLAVRSECVSVISLTSRKEKRLQFIRVRSLFCLFYVTLFCIFLHFFKQCPFYVKP